MLTENNHLKRKHQNDGNAEDGGHAETRLKVDKTSEEEKERQVSQFLARQGLSVRMAIQILEEGLEKKAEKLRGLRVGSGAVGLVLSLPMVLDLCSVLFSNACLCDSSAAW
jgi:hypothetical protein